jgi:hypothetical protein
MEARPRALYVLPSIPDGARQTVKNGLAIRNAASRTGRCPECGAQGELSGPDAAGLLHLTFRHDIGCRVFSDGEEA